MKKVLALLIPIMLISMLSAVDLDFSGEFRTRAAVYNNCMEDAGGHIDNRFRLALDSELYDGLNLHAMVEIGDITFGDSSTGGALSANAINIETSELYIDYMIAALDAKIRVGQQYWADHRSLVLDDYFSGVVLSKEDFYGLNAELAMMKIMENNKFAVDDYNVFMANLQSESPFPWGLMMMGGYYADSNNGNITIMPYVTLEAGPATLDITPFMDYQMYPGDNDEMGFGAAVKADMDMGMMQLGADLLLATENGITTLSPWYQNGLYIYGIGAHHDGLNLYWGTPYSHNSDTFISAVGKVRAPMGEKINLFAAAGMVQDLGLELNGGIEYQVIEDIMSLAGYAAFGSHDTNDVTNYAVGTTLQINY